MEFSDSRWQDYPDTIISTGAYILFHQGIPFDNCTHFTGPIDDYSDESEYNTAYTSGMDLAHFRMTNNEFSNKDPDVVPEQAPFIILYIKSAIYMSKNDEDTKKTRHITRIMNFVRNGK